MIRVRSFSSRLAVLLVFVCLAFAPAAGAMTWQKSNMSGGTTSTSLLVSASLAVAPVSTYGTNGTCTALRVTNNSGTAVSDLFAYAASGTTTSFQSCTYGTNPCGATLAAGASCNFGVQLLYTAPSGLNTETVTVGGTGLSVANVSVIGISSWVASTPPAFTFPAAVKQPLSTTIASNAVTLAGGNGYTDNWTVTCGTGCTGIQINGGAWQAGPVTGVNSGNTLAIRQVSSSSQNTATTATVLVSSTSATWSATTMANPNAITFTNQTNVASASTITSNALTLTGGTGNDSWTVTCGTGCTGISINGAAFVAGPVSNVNNYNTIAIRQTSSSTDNTQTTASVSVGNTTSATWSVTTGKASAFSFTDQTGVATNSTITSNAVTLTGTGGNWTATCGTGCTAIAKNGTWGGTTVTGFNVGDTIAIRQTSGASLTSTTATVSVGGTTSAMWSVKPGVFVVLTSGSSYALPGTTSSVKIWTIGAGGGGAGTYNGYGGGGGAAGGVAYKTFTNGVANATLSYSLGTGGTGGTNNTNGGAGGNTTATLNGTTLTANGGNGGYYNYSNGSSPGGSYSGGDGGATGGSGASGTSSYTNSGAGGGGIGGSASSTPTTDKTGTNGAQSVDVSGLFSVLTSTGYATAGVGIAGYSVVGGDASGFGCGGGGGGWYSGGKGFYGGGGGGSGYSGSGYVGGNGGNGAVALLIQ